MLELIALMTFDYWDGPYGMDPLFHDIIIVLTIMVISDGWRAE